MVRSQIQKKENSQAQLLEEMTQAIVAVASPEKIILFGSQARGTARLHSDYDFLIVEAEPFGANRSRRKASGKIGWALSRFLVPTDVLLFSTEEVKYWSQSLNHVVSCALREGKVLYDRSTTG
ncbi:MAG: nucleotidyltransferase domain-containing protein [Phormidesmis sp.]